MKKALKVILIIALIIILIVGGLFFYLNIPKDSITVSEFKSIMEEKEYELIDVSLQFAEYDFVEEAYLALDRENDYQIEFYELSDEKNAIAFYNNNKKSFEDSKSGSSVETNLNGKNYSRYVLSSGGDYMLLSRIDNTVIYVCEDVELKDTINDVLDELGY